MSALHAARPKAPKVFAIILAGGRGSRLFDLTKSQAKPAVPFAGIARLIDFPLSNCYNSGIRQIAVATQYCSADLSHHVQSAWSFLSRPHNEFVDLWPCHQRDGQNNWYAGTADAVCQNIDLLAKHAPDYILILAGDHIYKQDYSILIDDHIRTGADVTVSCLEVNRQDAKEFGCVVIDENDRITGFIEKPSNPPALSDDFGKSFVSMGIYVFSFEFLIQALRADERDISSQHDFGRNVIPAWFKRRKAYAHRFAKSCVTAIDGAVYWKDVGTIDAFWQAHMDLLQAQSPIDLFSGDWPIWTEQALRGPTRFLKDEDGRDGIATNSIISQGCTIMGARIKDSVICPDVRIGSGSSLERCVVLPGATIEEHCFYRDAVIGPNTIVPSFSSLTDNRLPASLKVYQSPGGKSLLTQSALYPLSKISEPRQVPANTGRALKLAAGD